MGEKLVIGPVNRGLRTDREPFNIDNDSFPTLINAYQWRGRVKRKRGTSTLGRLRRYFNSTSTSYNTSSPFVTNITLNGSGIGNILTGFGLQTNGNIIPGTVTLTSSSAIVYTDPAEDGTLSPSGSINYATGVITIVAEAGNNISAIFNYYPDLPALGLEDFATPINQFFQNVGFDTKYSYNLSVNAPFSIYDVSFYKNPNVNILLPGYVKKTNSTPTTWNGQDYQQFWTTNYEGVLWATNGIDVPFTGANIGMQYAPQNTITYDSNTSAVSPSTIVLTITNCPLVIGDFVFLNEFLGANAITLNLQTGYVTNVSGTPASLTVTITFPNATLGAGPYTPGIVQYLTNRSNPNLDCLRYYDGDPTNGNATNPSLTGLKGWVNFAPPLSESPFAIAEQTQAIYYLVGARMIVPFKDSLLFLGPVIQTSALNSQIYLQDTVIFSQNGTPFYTASFTGDPALATTVFFPLLTPPNHTATANAYWEDVVGYGGFRSAGLDQPINTVGANEDVLIIGLTTINTRLIYTSNTAQPFDFFIINSELGSGSTFSAVVMDRGVLTRGSRGYIITSQVGTQRIDLQIPDYVFDSNLNLNGTERVCSQRDFINEWVYFTYPANNEGIGTAYKFPNRTLQYNYRDESWAVFNECYTTYGTFRKQSGYTWANIGDTFPTWNDWNEPWNAGVTTFAQPVVMGGNQQGFVMLRDQGTGEGPSLYIRSFSASVVTSPDHTLNSGDYIIINGCLGTIGSQVNGNVFSIRVLSEDTFVLNPAISSGTYLGGGTITRMYVPLIQTRQFPMAWTMGRKTRLGPQQYLFSTTPNAQITLKIYLSMDASNPYNNGPIVPSANSENNALVYNNILYTCPESTNLGLTPANVNLQMPTAITQAQIWHRMNTSLIGDTVQIGFTLSDKQMRDVNLINQFAEIEFHGAIIDTNPSSLLV